MKREGGYTVLETGLAIAMSTTLVLLTFGLAAMVGRGRFRDSLVTTQSFIKQQYNEVRSGINSRLTGGSGTTADAQIIGGACGNNLIPGNNNRCYIIGRLLIFDNDSDNGRVQVSFIVAVVMAGSKWPDSTKTGLDNLNVKDGSVTLYALTNTSGNDAGLNPTVKQIGGNMLMKAWLVKSCCMIVLTPAMLAVITWLSCVARSMARWSLPQRLVCRMSPAQILRA